MCVSNMQLQMRRVSDLKENGYNPQSRTEPRLSSGRPNRKLEKLRESIRKHGLLAPIVISMDGLVIDGHRRLWCVKSLGIQEVMCLVSNVNAQLAWSEAVFTQTGMDGRQIVEASAQGMDSVYMPPGIAKQIDDLHDVAGDDLYMELVEAGIGVGILKAVNRVCKYTGDESPEWRRMVLRWLIRHKMQFEIRKAIDSDPLNENGTRDLMRTVINRDAPLRLGAVK